MSIFNALAGLDSIEGHEKPVDNTTLGAPCRTPASVRGRRSRAWAHRGTARCVEVALKKPTREEWREERYKVTHVPTEFWMIRLRGRPEPVSQRMSPDASEYELHDLISMGTVLLKEQWLREGGV
jgi:hypothetical protein